VRPSGVRLALAAGVTLALAWPGSANHVVMHGGPFAGVVTQLVPDPRQADVLYVAAFGSGVFKSVDAGRRWVAASRGLDDRAVLALALDPASPEVLYAGTDSGVFVSRDGGVSWRRAGAGIGGRNIRSLAVVSGRPGGLYAATDQGIRYSPDGGRSWRPRDAGLAVRDLRVVRLDPARPERVYAAGFGGIYRSEDRGRRWVAASDGLADRRVRALVVDPIRPDTLYAGTAGGGVFETTDGGGRWVPLNDGLRNVTVLSLLAGPSGQRVVGTVGGVHVWDPARAAWRLVGEGLLTLTVTFVETSPHRPGTIYAGTGGLVFASEDHGQHWEELAVSVAGPAGPAAASRAERR
jgi:photosystem II stability/assembly factor-like uncharacterized protein